MTMFLCSRWQSAADHGRLFELSHQRDRLSGDQRCRDSAGHSAPHTHGVPVRLL